MTLTFAMLAEWMQRLTWPMARIVGFMLIAPVFSAMTIPRRVRVGLVLALAVLLAPVIEPPAGSPFTLAGVALMVRDRKSTRLNVSPYCATRMAAYACKKKK